MRNPTKHLILLIFVTVFLVSGCQVRQLARTVLGGETKTNDALLIPITDQQISQGNAETPAVDSSPPTITVWEGSEQDFPYGSAQEWVNVMGKALDPETGIQSLQYTLNGEVQPHPLELGPTQRRLAGVGDFNVELSASALKDGENLLTITAVNGKGLQTQTTVTVNYEADQAWSLPYAIDWATVRDLQEVAQVVDGQWQITPDGIRVVQVGYDRVLAIGSPNWKDYEATVSVTIHAIDERAYQHRVSTNPGIGINLRWMGHTDDPPVCKQPPHCGWNPTGSSNWLEFLENQPARLQLSAEPPKSEQRKEQIIEPGKTYMMKARAESNTAGTLYSFKFWEKGAAEPQAWTLAHQADTTNLSHGSLLLVAHHVDVTFGNLNVAPIP